MAGGFGLHLGDALADRVDVRDTDPAGTTVRAGKRLAVSAWAFQEAKGAAECGTQVLLRAGGIGRRPAAMRPP